MKKSTIHISKMDCPSEENMIRMKLDGQEFVKLDFDIPNRNLYIYHESDINRIYEAVNDLNLGAALINSEESELFFINEDHSKEKKLFWTVLLINFSLFVLEIITGFFSGSMGLVALKSINISFHKFFPTNH
jgi:hypothetical protein